MSKGPIILSTAGEKVKDEKPKKTTTMAKKQNGTNRMNGLSIFHAPNVSKQSTMTVTNQIEQENRINNQPLLQKKIPKSEIFDMTMGHDISTKYTITQ